MNDLVNRRLLLCKHTPSCPACGSSTQIQLKDWMITPAEWKCRTCNHKWHFEPPSIPSLPITSMNIPYSTVQSIRDALVWAQQNLGKHTRPSPVDKALAELDQSASAPDETRQLIPGGFVILTTRDTPEGAAIREEVGLSNLSAAIKLALVDVTGETGTVSVGLSPNEKLVKVPSAWLRPCPGFRSVFHNNPPEYPEFTQQQTIDLSSDPTGPLTKEQVLNTMCDIQTLSNTMRHPEDLAYFYAAVIQITSSIIRRGIA